jgi:glycosyltransferase involved in cell wall biosynthesis
MSYDLISVVLPVRNQADHIAAIVHGYEAALSALDSEHELLLVPNACRDGSDEICHGLAHTCERVRAEDCDRAGWGAAVKVGLARASGDLLCYTNSARTTASDLVLMLRHACANPNVVVKANRTVRDSWRRRLGSLLYNLECRLLFDLPYWDVNGTPKLFPRTFGKLLELTRDDDLIDAEFNAIVSRAGYPMIEIPLVSTIRHGGKSTTSYRSALNLYWGAYKMARGMSSSRR